MSTLRCLQLEEDSDDSDEEIQGSSASEEGYEDDIKKNPPKMEPPKPNFEFAQPSILPKHPPVQEKTKQDDIPNTDEKKNTTDTNMKETKESTSFKEPSQLLPKPNQTPPPSNPLRSSTQHHPQTSVFAGGPFGEFLLL